MVALGSFSSSFVRFSWLETERAGEVTLVELQESLLLADVEIIHHMLKNVCR